MWASTFNIRPSVFDLRTASSATAAVKRSLIVIEGK